METFELVSDVAWLWSRKGTSLVMAEALQGSRESGAVGTEKVLPCQPALPTLVCVGSPCCALN